MEEVSPEDPADYEKNVIKKTVDLSSTGCNAFPKTFFAGVDENVTELFVDYNDLTEIPGDLSHCLPNLEILSANGNQINVLPGSLSLFLNLKQLELVENELVSLPSEISHLQHLEMLRLTGNKLKALSDKFSDLAKLKFLYMEENSLKSLPASLGRLKKLKVLEVSNNRLQCLPKSVGDLIHLEVLNISNNQVGIIPESFEKLSSLEHLDLSFNGIEYLPSRCRSVKTLKKFYAECNLLKALPDWVNFLPEIREFSVKDNHLPHKPLTECFGNTNLKLRSLDISGNFVTHLPESLGNLECLEELYMGSVIDELERRNFQNGNWVCYLPESCCWLTNLKEICLDENQLRELPDNFGDLYCLEFLDIGQNMLTSLPNSFCNLKRLRVCQLSKNSIERLPDDMGELESLEDLRLDNNKLTELPESFGKLVKLKSLDLFNNELTEIPPVVMKLKNLVRLDMGENKFKIPWHKVPVLRVQNHYAPRNPDLKDNWRGRPRADVQYHDTVTNSIVVEPVELSEEEEGLEDAPYSSDVMRRAAERSLSFWKSHNGPQTRPISLPQTSFENFSGANVNGEEDDGWLSEKDESETEDERESDTDDLLDTSLSSENKDDGLETENGELGCVSKTEQAFEEEDWDEEIENSLGPYDDVPIYQHPPRDHLVLKHEVRDHFFPAWDIHAKVVERSSCWEDRPVEEGQFDDCEED